MFGSNTRTAYLYVEANLFIKRFSKSEHQDYFSYTNTKAGKVSAVKNFASFIQLRWKYPLSFTPSLTSQKDAWSPWRAGWMDVEISPHWRNHISRNPNLALTFDFSTLLTCLDHGSSWLRPPHRGERGKPRRRSWSQPETFKLLPSSLNLQRDDGKVGILTFFGAQSNIGLLRFSRMWKLGFLGGSSSLSGVGGLLVNGTECWKLKTI